ncbi:MAG: DsbA family protein [Micavibrio sp.]
MTRSTMYAAMTAILVAFSPLAAQAQDTAAAPAFNEAQMKALDTVIHDYIMENPRVIMDAVEQYRQNQDEMDAKAFSVKIKEKHEAIYNDPSSPVAGDKDGDVTLVEFFDYNCGYCKQAFKDVQKLIDEDKKLRVVFKEIPILSESSHTAARYAQAADKQGKYWEFHQALMNSSGQINEAKLESVAKDVGLDVEKLKKDADSAEIRTAIEKNLELARSIGISGTPGFVIGDQALRGHYGLEALRKSISELRAAKPE